VALDAGVNTLELDLHFTKDAQVVIWHDPIVSSEKCEVVDPAESARLNSEIASLSLVEIGKFRCSKNPDSGRFPDQTATPTTIAGDDYSIIRLGELFEFVTAYSKSELKTPDQRANAEAVRFNIETKRLPERPETINDGFDGETPGPFEVEVLKAIATAGLQGRVTIQSFDHRSLRAIRTADDSTPLAALTRRNEPFDSDFADFAQIWSPDYRSLSAASLIEAQAAGMMVIPWTVNDTSDMNRLIDLGVDGLITDRPDTLIQEIAGRP
jgi:glycerophosphoryl diester phosphodiesterase